MGVGGLGWVGGGGIFWLRGNNLNNLGRGPLGEAIKYQRPGHSAFRQEDLFYFFPIWVYVKQVTLHAGPFLTPGI